MNATSSALRELLATVDRDCASSRNRPGLDLKEGRQPGAMGFQRPRSIYPLAIIKLISALRRNRVGNAIALLL